MITSKLGSILEVDNHELTTNIDLVFGWEKIQNKILLKGLLDAVQQAFCILSTLSPNKKEAIFICTTLDI